MAGPNSRRLGTICRIYKNASGNIIATESVEVTADMMQLADKTFFRSIGAVNVSRKLVHMVAGASRVIASMIVMGDYDVVEEDSGNYLNVTWAASSANQNNVVFSLEGKVAVIGDTV